MQSAGVGCMVLYRVRWVHKCALCSNSPFSIRVMVRGARCGCRGRMRILGVISTCHVPLLNLLSFWCGVQGAGAGCGCGVHGAVGTWVCTV